MAVTCPRFECGNFNWKGINVVGQEKECWIMNEHLCEECCVCKEEVELVSGVARPDFQRQIKGVVSS